MSFLSFISALLVVVSSVQCQEDESHPSITLFDLPDFEGDSFTMTQGLPDIEFNDKADSVCGTGLWFLYEDPEFKESSSFVHNFASYEYACENLDFTQTNLITSARFAGGFSVDEESLTLYKDYRFCGNELVTLKDLEYLGDYNNDVSSFAVLGNSSWTIYKERAWTGTSACLVPRFENGFNYGLFDADSVGFPDNRVSSVKKGCHTEKIADYYYPNK